MCDYHSICVRVDGAIVHQPSNSHSEAVFVAGWPENQLLQRRRFWEFEWDGEGDMPPIGLLVHLRGREAPPQKVLRAAERHYHALARVHGTGVLPARFRGDEFVDVRLKLAANPHVTAEAQQVLAADADAVVRWRLAANLHVTAEAQQVLAADADAAVRWRLHITAEAQQVLARAHG